HPVDVDQRGRCCEPHGEQREQRLAAGEHLGALTLVREDREGLVEGGGVGVAERSWFHRLSVPSPWLCRAARCSAATSSSEDGSGVSSSPCTWPKVDAAAGCRPSRASASFISAGARARATCQPPTATIVPSAMPPRE